MLLVHVDRGRPYIEQLEQARDYQLVVSASDQARNPNLLADCLEGLPGPEASSPQPDANHPPLCNRLRDARRGMQITRTELGRWIAVSERLAFFWPRGWFAARSALPPGLSEEQWGSSELRASSLMAGFTGFILPMLLGLLGAFTYVYRDIDKRVRTATLSPGDGVHGTLRILVCSG